nr:EOG090X07KM [Cyclestheria hislopi]
METSVDQNDDNVPLGCLESPCKTPSNAHVIRGSNQQKNTFQRRAFNILRDLVSFLLIPMSALLTSVEIILEYFNTPYIIGKHLEGKIVLITGASSGLGEALARSFYAQGCRLILSSRNRKELERVREELTKSNLQQDTIHIPSILPLDVSDFQSAEPKIRAAIQHWGHIDILINNAGLSYRGEVVDTSLGVDIQLMNVNYFGAVALTKAVLPYMISRKSGHIVMIGSLQSKLAIPFRSAYTASKHALQAFSDSLRAEVQSLNIQVTVVNPGYIKTNLSRNALTGNGAKYGKMDPSTESGLSPSVVANAVVNAVKRKKKEVLSCSVFHKLVVLIRVIFPELYFWAMKKRASHSKRD